MSDIKFVSLLTSNSKTVGAVFKMDNQEGEFLYPNLASMIKFRCNNKIQLLGTDLTLTSEEKSVPNAVGPSRTVIRITVSSGKFKDLPTRDLSEFNEDQVAAFKALVSCHEKFLEYPNPLETISYFTTLLTSSVAEIEQAFKDFASSNAKSVVETEQDDLGVVGVIVHKKMPVGMLMNLIAGEPPYLVKDYFRAIDIVFDGDAKVVATPMRVRARQDTIGMEVENGSLATLPVLPLINLKRCINYKEFKDYISNGFGDEYEADMEKVLVKASATNKGNGLLDKSTTSDMKLFD